MSLASLCVLGGGRKGLKVSVDPHSRVQPELLREGNNAIGTNA